MGVVARPRSHTDDVRTLLLDEAVRMVAADGIGALSVREAARAADTSTTAVYSLFGNKEGLARAILVRAFDAFADAQRSAAAAATDPTALAELGVAYVGWALENPRLYELMFGDALVGVARTEETRAAATRAITPLREGVQAAITAGVFRDADTDTVVASLWAQVHGMAMLLLSGNYPDGADPVAAATAVIDGWRPARA
ncbi:MULTISPECIES: TetR/AcrR family transcriptional regulator [unclassified Gordonia (in: high G+C Gram-positive bacteria)]|uniref:TetR/AcrR family transcriptional regulator n=1 Tax=unclassified Gordonia (in: high G+C Gram-positive bacteria) TaxID=2657482 RepID=UPI00071D7C02|nr:MULTISPECIES: TetR/AcrR family transcriptional regulator [unclassified Gordonia (in: high G+C Gram-positive bacteria)]KSU52277.1 TetR family transcriptional regulator [Gordonia sp. SGD-V-85]MDT0220083.1 TetR/AcrR family transcriptional regulator [Gordonia sp. AC31]SCC58704.1 transcriptional regulator, TetR family [Gordonia sp. v-85]